MTNRTILLLLLATSSTFAADNDGKLNTSLHRLKAALHSVPSRVVGSPEPPLPFRVESVLPELKLESGIFVVNEPGSSRLIVIEKNKLIRRTTDDPSTGELKTMLEMPEKATAFSIAFHSKFDSNGYAYIGWNDRENCYISRFTFDRKPPFEIDKASRLDIISWASNGHNGVAVTFGLDGMLYVTSGDGTSDSDTNIKGQGLDHLLSKVLRLDVDHPDKDRPYSVPKDNPFVGQKNVRPETWAYGFRNPWRMTTDPVKGHIWVGNNGQDLWEQIYLVERGANYGWSVYEGGHPFYLERKLGPTPVSKPTLDHPHSEARSLTGGVVYYGKKLPLLRGAYLYGDYSTGKIWAARVEGRQIAWHQEIADSKLAISSFAIDGSGELLILDHRKGGGLFTLVPNDAKQNTNFPRKLSESGLFASVAEHRLHEGAIPYSVNAPLWSDGALKERYLVLPKEPAKLNINANRGWSLPDGTVAVKSFALELEAGNPESRQWIETRFLTREQGEWVGYSYAWNEDGTDAELVDKKGRDTTFTVKHSDGKTHAQKWRFPSRAECMVCHSRAAVYLLGLSTAQFNKVHDYGDVKAEQLRVLDFLGVLNRPIDPAPKKKDEQPKAPKTTAEFQARLMATVPEKLQRLANPYDKTQDLNLRARAYLHANCAQCHVEAGGGNAQMNLEFRTTDPKKFGVVDHLPLHDKFGVKDARIVAPGEPDRSVLLKRIAMRGRGQMPQLATTQVDREAVELIREWIEKMEK